MKRRKKIEVYNQLQKLTDEKIYDLVIVKKLSKQFISKKYKLSVHRIQQRIEEAGLEEYADDKKGRKFSVGTARNREEFVKKIIFLYKQGYTQQKIAKQFKTTSSTICRLLKENNIKARQTGRSPAGIERIKSSINMDSLKEILKTRGQISGLAKKLKVPYSSLYYYIKENGLLPKRPPLFED